MTEGSVVPAPETVVVVEKLPGSIVEVVLPGPPGPQGAKGDVGDVNPQMPVILASTESARDAAVAASLLASTKADTATTKASEATLASTQAQEAASTSTNQAATATTQATAANTSAANASLSAGVATTKAAEATTSASGAAASALTATNKAGSATTSANTATAKATEASNSASAALASKDAAALSETNTAASTLAAATSATNAATAEANTLTLKNTTTTAANNAAASETAAVNAKNTAVSAATTATTKADEAATSATAAAADKVAAASSATTAQNAATTAQNAAASADAAGHIANTNNPHSTNKTHVGLGNVDDTADVNKPVSTAQQTALNLKANVTTLSAHSNNTNNPHSTTKTHVGLGNVDNTSDANKPVSTAQATAIAAKQATIAAGTTAQYYRGDKTWRDFATDVRATVLTGVSFATATAITATDSVLVAFGKVQKQLTDLIASVALKAALNSPVFTGTPTTPTAATSTNSLQLANTAFVQSAIAALVNSSPTTLDTLNELATALGNDPNFATTMTNSLANKAGIFGGSQSGGVIDWNDVSNTKPGYGPTVLNGSAANGPGTGEYFHVLNFEYSSNNGTGNVTQMAISYNGNGLYMRYRYSGAWSGWVKFMASTDTATNTNAVGGFSSNFVMMKRRDAIQAAQSTSLNASIAASETGFPYGGSGEPYGPFISFGGISTAADYTCQLVGAYSGGNDFKIRTRNGDNQTWNTWRSILTDSSFQNWVPSLTGAGASGTWGINISGNAATATSANNATTAASCSGNSATATSATTAAACTGTLDTANSTLCIGRVGGRINGYVYNDTSGIGFLTNGGGWALRVDYGTNNVTGFGNVGGFSDERLKTNWREFDKDFVKRLAGVKNGIYDRTDTELTQVGVSAQSLQPLMPHAVSESEDGTLSVVYGNAALASSVELAKYVVALEERIAQLEGK